MWIPSLALCLLPLLQNAASAPKMPFPVPCTIDAWLESPGGRIEFKLDVRAPRRKGGTPNFALLSGARREDLVWIERWEKMPTSILLHIDSYDSHLEFPDMQAVMPLKGTWRKLIGPDQWLEMPLRGNIMAATPAAPAAAATPPSAPIDGRWAVKFASSDIPAVGVFAHPSPDKLSGTFLTTLGDYRYLAGGYDYTNKRWQLSCFDGAHAFLFSAKLQDDGTLSGEFWSGDKPSETWTAKRDPQAALPDAFGLTKEKPGVDLSKLLYTAADGSKVSLADPKFAGKPRIIQLFGSWCPNCNDEAEYLKVLDHKYRNAGLQVIGLGFELTGDEQRDLAQIALFAKRHSLTYPLLLAGKSDKADASRAFPLLDAVRAFPTTIFMRADGSVLAVHQGYSGPATIDAHQKLREDFERRIQELIAVQKTR
ncbi:MAG TPA: TlpA disulfide reductase family protein [Planctomycetota bacterium]|nr:TlpA disulfide reductase family protein [Planctomycetota bacterium]